MMYGFEYLGNSLEILRYRYFEEEAARGNPYNSQFYVKIVSNGFAGIAECEYDRKEWDEFIHQLELLNDFKVEKVVFNDICYGSEISFVMDDIGHITASGFIYGPCMIQTLQFKFDADQTILTPFINALKKL